MRHLFLSAALTALIPGVAWAAPDCTGAVAACERATPGALSLLVPGRMAMVVVDTGDEPGVARAASDLVADLKAVGGGEVRLARDVSGGATVIAGTLGHSAVIDALVKAGANQIDGPALSLSQPDAALDAARADAVKRAQARASLYAQAAGLRVDRILSISEAGENDGGQPQPPVMFRVRAMAADSAAATQVLPGETDVTATINVRFVLK